MKAVSPLFLASLTGAHAMVASLRICGHGPSPALGVELPILSGQVNLDGSAAIRASLDVTVAGTWPTAADVTADGRIDGTAPVPHPYGVQVQPSRGIRYGAGTSESVALGVFVVTRIEQAGSRTSPAIRITGQDRACLVAAAGSVEDLQFFFDTSTWDDLVTAVLALGSSLLTYVLDFDGTTLLGDDLILEAGKDPWAFLVAAVAALGKVAWFDANGVCRIASPPDPGTPVWTVASGAGGVMVSTGRHLTREGQYNGVLAIGEKSSDVLPATAVAYDTGPASSTAWGDAFGRRLKVLQSNLIISDSDAVNAAAVELRRTVGLPYGLDLGAVPNPALEPWDVLSVQHPDGSVELHSVDRVTIPLSATDPVQLSTRETSTVVVALA